MLTFIKLGGSLITDKREEQVFRVDLMQQAASEIASARRADSTLKLLIGHGSGSFGHMAANKYGTMQGVQTADQWRGFAEVAYAARKLNTLVMEVLYEAELPVIAIPPFASAYSHNGKILRMETHTIQAAIDHDLVPVVYGDVSLDDVRGGTIISTETVFDFLTERLTPRRIFLLGEVDGVYAADGSVIPRIDSTNSAALSSVFGGSSGTDVTGGMASKVGGMLDLVQRVAGLEIRIFGGLTPGQLQDALLNKIAPGTLITS